MTTSEAPTKRPFLKKACIACILLHDIGQARYVCHICNPANASSTGQRQYYKGTCCLKLPLVERSLAGIPCQVHFARIDSEISESDSAKASEVTRNLGTMFATRNKCIASSNRCLTSSNKKLLGTSASLLVTSALLVVTRSY